MTDGPASEPTPQQPPTRWPGQPWPAQPNAPQYPGYPPAQQWAPPANGVWLGVTALVLGLLGCVVPLLPIDLSGIRAYLAFPFGLPGLACGLVGVIGRRTGKPLSGVGIGVSALALVFGMIMLASLAVG